jgi:hypothetical protein
VAGTQQQQQHGGSVESPPWRGPPPVRPGPPASASASAFVYDAGAAGDLDEEWIDDGEGDLEELTL